MCKWALKPTGPQMKTARAFGMPRAVPDLVWGQIAPLTARLRSQLHRSGRLRWLPGFESVFSASDFITPATNLPREDCFSMAALPYATENLMACPKWKAKGRGGQREQVWDLAWTLWTGCAEARLDWLQASPLAHHWYHSVSETLRNTVQNPGFPAAKPIKTGLLYYSCVLIVQH